MKHLVVLLLTCTVVQINVANARLKIPIGNQEVLEKVADLPDTPEYAINEGSSEHFDLGRLYEKYVVAWLPFSITKEPKLVGINAKGDEYYELDEAQLNAILSANKLSQEDLLKIGFFSRHGGKIVGIALLALIIYGYLPSKSKKIKPQNV